MGTNNQQPVRVTDERQKAVFDLLFWQNGHSNFTSQLYGLIAKADVGNRKKLWVVYPDNVEIYEEWATAENSDAFFAKYGLRRVTKQETDIEQSA